MNTPQSIAGVSSIADSNNNNIEDANESSTNLNGTGTNNDNNNEAYDSSKMENGYYDDNYDVNEEDDVEDEALQRANLATQTLQEFNIDFQEVELKQEIGRGRFGTVYK